MTYISNTGLLIAGGSKTVTICGSFKYTSEMFFEYEKLSLEGNVVLLPVFKTDEDADRSEREEYILDWLHQKKIRMSDFIYVVNPGGYHGMNTQMEIDYASMNDIPVVFMEPTTVSF